MEVPLFSFRLGAFYSQEGSEEGSEEGGRSVWGGGGGGAPISSATSIWMDAT